MSGYVVGGYLLTFGGLAAYALYLARLSKATKERR